MLSLKFSKGFNVYIFFVESAEGLEANWTQLEKLFEDRRIDPEQVVPEEFDVIDVVSIASEKVTTMEVSKLTDEALSAGEVEETVGAVESVVSGVSVVDVSLRTIITLGTAVEHQGCCNHEDETEVKDVLNFHGIF